MNYIQNLTQANKILQEEFKSEIENLNNTFSTKEIAYKSELDSLMKDTQLESINSHKKQIDQKYKIEDTNKDSFLKRELDDYKTRNTEIKIKRNYKKH